MITKRTAILSDGTVSFTYLYNEVQVSNPRIVKLIHDRYKDGNDNQLLDALFEPVEFPYTFPEVKFDLIGGFKFALGANGRGPVIQALNAWHNAIIQLLVNSSNNSSIIGDDGLSALHLLLTESVGITLRTIAVRDQQQQLHFKPLLDIAISVAYAYLECATWHWQHERRDESLMLVFCSEASQFGSTAGAEMPPFKAQLGYGYRLSLDGMDAPTTSNGQMKRVWINAADVQSINQGFVTVTKFSHNAD